MGCLSFSFQFIWEHSQTQWKQHLR